MKFLALISGGKDSIYTICQLLDDGHELVGLLHMKSSIAYADSYMFQTVGSEVVELIGLCLNCPLFIYETACKPINLNLEYTSTEGDEVEELFQAVQTTSATLDFEAISSGAILSNYQRKRVENICVRLNKTSLCPLWERNQKELLQEMVAYGLEARIVKVASTMLNKSCLNMSLDQILRFLNNTNSKYEINYCGEGGEYESIVLDCKHFKSRIDPGEIEIHCHPEEVNKDGGVFYLRMKNLRLQNKNFSTY